MRSKHSAQDTLLQCIANSSGNAMSPRVASGGKRLHADWSADDNRQAICSLIELFHETVFALLGHPRTSIC